MLTFIINNMKPKINYPLSLIFITFAVYAQILWHDFFYHWDDQWVVINTFTEKGFTLENLWDVLTTFYHGQYAPMNELSYIAIYSLFGFNATAFHGASLLWHIGNVVLMYLFVSRLVTSMGICKEGDKNKTIAWLTALTFAVHPMAVESVAWISASKILVYSFFYILALYVYTFYVVNPTVRKYILLLILFTLSFLGKEQAVVLPLTFILIDAVISRKGSWKALIAEKLPFLVLTLLFGIITILSQGHSETMPNYCFTGRIVYACNALCDYFFRSLFPVNLSYIYPFPTQPNEPLPITLMIYPLLVLIGLFVIFRHRKNKILLFCTMFFVIHLLVTIHIISLSRFTLTADRYSYIALMAPSFFLAYVITCLRDKKHWSKLALSVYIIYLCCFVTYSSIYIIQWRDTDTLKSHIREILEERKTTVSKTIIEENLHKR